MINDLIIILFFVIISSFLGLIGGIILLKSKKIAYKLSYIFVAFAIGALLSTAFLDLLPEALEKGNNIENVFISALIGILIFFLIEKFVIWHHHHTYGEKEKHSYNSLVIIGDTIHNFIDGVILTAAFIVSPFIGITAFIAIVMHEIPQEISDFGILLHGKMKRKKILIISILSSLASVVGVFISYYFITSIVGIISPIIGFSAGVFIYIAASDLIPETKKIISNKKSLIQILLIILGILLIWYTGQISHQFIHL